MADRPTRRPTTGLVEHDVALDTLLSSLLAEVPEYDPAAAPAPVLNPASPAPITQAEPDTAPWPEWARPPLRVLLFSVGGMQFAVPLLMLRAVSQLTQPPHEVPGRPAWHRGVVRYRGESLVVADLGRLLGIRASSDDPDYLLVIGDGDVAIACDALGEAFTAQPEALRWRRGAGDRVWLAGLLTGPMCALLDVAEIDRRIRHG